MRIRVAWMLNILRYFTNCQTCIDKMKSEARKCLSIVRHECKTVPRGDFFCQSCWGFDRKFRRLGACLGSHRSVWDLGFWAEGDRRSLTIVSALNRYPTSKSVSTNCFKRSRAACLLRTRFQAARLLRTLCQATCLPRTHPDLVSKFNLN